MNEDKSARYPRLKRRADLLGTALSAAFLLWLLLSGAGFYLREVSSFLGGRTPGYEEPVTVAAFAALLSLALQLLTLPVSHYQGYRLEHEYGLSNQTLGQWLKDQAKAGALGMVLAALGASIVYWALRTSPSWWWVISAAVLTLIMVGIVQLAPVLLLPLFYTFKPLDRPALVERLLALAGRARTRIVGVYEWALSAHTKKANAALAGLDHQGLVAIGVAGSGDDAHAVPDGGVAAQQLVARRGELGDPRQGVVRDRCSMLSSRH